MNCNHKSLSAKSDKSIKKEIIDCQSDNCNYHVEKMLPSVFIMGLYYLFSGLILSAICLLPIFYIDNIYFRIFAVIPLGIFGIWGFNVSGAGLYICALCFVDQHVITDTEGKRYKHIAIKTNSQLSYSKISSQIMEIN